MADEKEEAKITEQETITPAEGKKDELSEQDLSKASGGALFIKFADPAQQVDSAHATENIHVSFETHEIKI
jgi:hypothetical protein